MNSTTPSMRHRSYFRPKTLPFLLTLLVLITGLRVRSAIGASEPGPFHVLILSSYHHGYTWTEDIIAGIQDVFATYDQPVEFSYEYLDTKRYAETAAYYEHMAGVFEHKYRERPIDLLILSDNSAFDFVVAYQERVFPGVPVVFCGINNYTPVMRERIPHSSGVAEFKEMDATLAVMLRLHPNMGTVAIISDVTGTGLIDADLIRKAVVEHGALDIVELSGGDLSFSELLFSLRQLPPDTGIFFSSFWRDRTGTSYEVEVILPLIVEVAEAPVYTHADTFVIGGVVGGVLVHGRTQGRLAGEIAVRILNGESPAAIPVSYKANAPVFDYAALKRWRIDLHTLPPDALILNPPPPSFYEQYRTVVWAVIAVMTVLLTLVIGLAITVLSRRRAEAALRASEERYRSLIEHSNDAIYLLYDGRFDLINPRFAALFGVTPEEVRAPDFNFMSLVAPASRPLIEQRTKELQTGHAMPSRYEFTALNHTGEEIEVEVSVSYLAYRDGLATQGIVRDISERKRAQEALTQSEVLFRHSIEMLPLGCVITDGQGNVTYINHMFTQMFGFTIEDIPHADDWFNKAYLDPNYRQHVMAVWNTDIVRLSDPKENLVPHTFAVTTKDGRTRTVEFRQSFIGSRLLILFNDITERQHTENALRESEQRFRELIELAVDGILLGSPEGVIIGANSRMLALLNIAAEALLGKHVREIFTPDSLQENPLRFDLLARGETVITERILQRADGTHVYVEMHSKQMPDGGYQSIVHDITERKQAEEALRESRAMLNLILDTVPQAIFWKDRAGRYLGCNKTFAVAVGLDDPTHIVGKTDFDLPWSHEEAEAYRADDLEVIEHNRPKRHIIEPLRQADGARLWIDTSKVPLVDDDGRPFAVLGAYEDITERIQTEEKLAASQRMLNDVINTIPVRVFWKDLEGRFLGCNRLFAADAGRPDPESLLGDTDYNMGWAEQADLYRADDRAVIEQDAPKINYEEPQTAPDGRQRWLRTSKIPLRDGEAHVYGILGVYEDITERKNVESALQLERAQLLSIFDSIDELIYVSDPHTYDILFVNQKLHDVLRKDVVGGICYQEFQGLDTPCPFCTNAIILQNKPTPYRWEHHNPKVDRDFVIVDRIITWPDGRDVRFELAVDITDRKLLETQLRRHEQLAAIGQLAAGIAHDFRNLLTTIILYAQLGQRQANLPPTLTQYLETINREAHKATDLVQQILDFGRRVQIERRSLDMIPFVGNVIGVLQRTLPENIHITFDVGTGPCIIAGDAGRLQQVLMNLALNARDAMPDGGTLRIGLTRLTITPSATPPLTAMAQATAPLAWIYLSVADTGTGMSEEAYAHRFEPFFTTKEPEQGTGLGLAQVYGIVQLHDGHIDVTTVKRQGTTFHIYLPAATTIAEETAPTATPLPAGHGEMLLVVEDNAQLRKASQSLLTDLGYRVLTAANGREALALYETNSTIALLITDLVMPEMGGKALLKALRSHTPHLKAVVMTGYTAEESGTELRADGFLEVIRKPLDAECLAGAVRRALDLEGNRRSHIATHTNE